MTLDYTGVSEIRHLKHKQSKKKKKDKLEFTKTEHCCASKDTIKKIKTPTEWKQISANHVSKKTDKGKK